MKMFNPKTEKQKYNFIIQDREAGNFIAGFDTLEEAEKALAEYEAEDTCNGCYEPDFYEIEEIEK